jgi:HAD superfamily hydrolase (TIGR01509 family)
MERLGVGFDVDHTLVIDNKLERVAFLRLLELVLQDGGHSMGTLTEECDHVDALLVRQRGGAFSIDDAVRRFVIERGVVADDSYVEYFRRIALEMVDAFVVPLPGARRTIEALRERGFVLAVLSNGWNPLQEYKVRRAGFDGPVLASADIGALKPSPRTFEALLETLGTPADRTWYVGDEPHGDVAGAMQAGIKAIWMDADGRTYPPDQSPPFAAIRALDELLTLLPERGECL